MVNSILSIFFIALISSASFSQTYLTQFKPVGSKEWGYMNQEGKVNIPAKYRKCFKFSSEGFAPVYVDKKYSFVNKEGQVLNTKIANYYLKEAAMFGIGLLGFDDGMVPVRYKGGKWGYMNTNGELTIPMQYEYVSKFDAGYACVRKGENDFVILNKTGEEIKLKIHADKIKNFSEGLAPYSVGGNWGFINEKGESVIAVKFVSVGYFNAGLAWAKTSDKKVGFINQEGEWVIEPQYIKVGDFDAESGLARVKSQDVWFYVDKSGKPLYVNDTVIWGEFNEGLAKGKIGEKIGFFDNQGNWVIPPKFDAVRDFKNGYAAAKKDDMWGIINKSGEWAIQPSFAAVKDMERAD